MKRAIVATIALLMFACVLPMAQGQEPASNEEVTRVSTNEAVPVNVEEVVRVNTEEYNQQAQDQLARDIAKLQARLEQLKAQQQELQNQLKALSEQRSQMRAGRREPAPGRGGGESMPPEAREQLRHAQEQARRAQDEAKRALKEADRAQQEALRVQVEAHRHTQAEGQQWEQWAESEPMKNWQRDMEKWGKQMEQWGQEFGRRQAAAMSGSESESGSREMPPMPPMPPMPAMPAMPPTPAVPPVPPIPTEVPAGAEGLAQAVHHAGFSSIPGDKVLEIRNHLGSITVRRGDAEEYTVRATITAKAQTEERAREIAEQLTITETGVQNDGVDRILVSKPEGLRNREGCTVALEVTAPRDVRIKLYQEVGDIRLTGLRGSIDATTKVGSIQATDVAGRVNLTTDVGSIGFFAPRDFSARVQAKAAMGSVQSDFPLDVVKPHGVAMGSSASGTIGDGEGELSLKTNVGSIGIRYQDAIPGRVERRRAAPQPRPEPRPEPRAEREL